MITREEWKLMCADIEKYLQDISIDTIDYYLVGSKVDNENSNSDFDSLIVVDTNSKDLDVMKELRLKLDTFINTEGISSLFHYKLFNAVELKYIAAYDAFRLADFQRRNISIKNSNVINFIDPILDERSFVNSFLIQLVHKFMHNFNSPNLEEIYDKLLFWVQFNLDIKELIPKSSVNFHYFISRDMLVANLWNYFHSKNRENAEIITLLKEYFSRIRHEYINKYGSIAESVGELS